MIRSCQYDSILMLASCAAAGCATTTMAYAQAVRDNGASATPTTAGSQPIQNTGTGPQISEIIVTAQKRSSSVQRVPSAIVAADAAMIRSLQITTTNDLNKLAPGLQLTPVRNQSAIFLRGIGQGVIGVNSDPYVSFNLNNAYLPQQVTNIAFYDIDRVEVLYGPKARYMGVMR